MLHEHYDECYMNIMLVILAKLVFTPKAMNVCEHTVFCAAAMCDGTLQYQEEEELLLMLTLPVSKRKMHCVCLCTHTHACIYITYIHTYMHTYIHTYIKYIFM